MHKKLENDLLSLAHSVLQMKNRDDVFALKEKAQEIYEKLSLLSFVEEYVNTTPNLEKTKENLLLEVENGLAKKQTTNKSTAVFNSVTDHLQDQYLDDTSEKIAAKSIADLKDDAVENASQKEVLTESKPLEAVKEQEIEQPFDALEGLIFGDTKAQDFKNDLKDVGERNVPTLEEELQDTIPVDVMANLFEPVKQTSLNDKLSGNIQIGLNDRIAFVKHLFDGSQEDFNRVVSQLNTLKTEKEAKNFINKIVKPDYKWDDKEDVENRFMEIIVRKFA